LKTAGSSARNGTIRAAGPPVCYKRRTLNTGPKRKFPEEKKHKKKEQGKRPKESSSGDAREVRGASDASKERSAQRKSPSEKDRSSKTEADE